MNKFLVIGNSGLKHKINDGQTVKTRVYLNKIRDEGYCVSFIDIEDFVKHSISIVLKIKREIKECDRIILIVAERGAKFLIPFINFLNRKTKKPFILPLIGIGVLHRYIDPLNDEDKQRFISDKGNSYKAKKKDIKNLKCLTYILPETELISDVYKSFFGLKNVFTLNNFRDEHLIIQRNVADKNKLKLVYLSRIWKTKGIFDLLDVVREINEEKIRVCLDIYGPKELDDKENILFDKIIEQNKDISYHGSISENEVVTTLAKYDLLVFPTRYFGEGTPGIISESLLAGTPILTSNFPQARFLLRDGYNAIFYEMFNIGELKNKLISIINNRDLLSKLSMNALESGRAFNYDYSRDDFLFYVCGANSKI